MRRFMSVNTIFFWVWLIGGAIGTGIHIVFACCGNTNSVILTSLPWGEIWVIVWGAVWFICYRIIPKKIFGELNILD